MRRIVAQERSKCNLNQKKARLDVVAHVRVWEVGRQNVGGRNLPNINFLPTIPTRSLDYCDAMTISHSKYLWNPPNSTLILFTRWHLCQLPEPAKSRLVPAPFTYSPRSRIMHHEIFKLQVADSSTSLRLCSSFLSGQQCRRSGATCPQKLRECFQCRLHLSAVIAGFQTGSAKTVFAANALDPTS